MQSPRIHIGEYRLILLPGSVSANAAQRLRFDTHVGGNYVLGHPHDQIRILTGEMVIPLFGIILVK